VPPVPDATTGSATRPTIPRDPPLPATVLGVDESRPPRAVAKASISSMNPIAPPSLREIF
jgi:hypothetical protein